MLSSFAIRIDLPCGSHHHRWNLYHEVRRNYYVSKALNGNSFVFQTQGKSTTSPLNELRQRLGLPAVAVVPAPEIGIDDDELLALGKELLTSMDQNSSATATSLLQVRL